MTVTRRYLLASAVDQSTMQRCIAPGALEGPLASSPGQIVDVPLDEEVAGYAETADEYMEMLGYTFVAEDPAQSLEEAGMAVTPYVDKLALLQTADVSGAIELDWTASLNQEWTVTGDVGPITFKLPPSFRQLTLMVRQDAVGGHVIPLDAWPNSVEWAFGEPPIFDDIGGALRIVTLTMIGAKIYAQASEVFDNTLLHFADGTFANALGNRTLWANGILHGPFAAGVPAVALIDGKRYYQSEGAATNDVDDSEDFTEASWGSLGSETVTPDAGPSPEAGAPVTADSITFTAAAGDGVKTTIAGVADNKKAVVSVFAQTTSGTKGFRLQILLKDGTTATSAEKTATTAYERFDFAADVLSGGTTPEMRILNDAGATAGVALFWGAMADDGGGAGAVYPSSYFKTDGAPVTRPADSMSFTAAQTPTAMREGKWKYSLIMQGTQAEPPPASSVAMDFMFGTTGPTVLGMRFTHEPKGRVYDYRAASQKVISSALTWSRQQTVTTKYDTIAGSITTEGATTGDGVVVGTSWSGVILPGDNVKVGMFYSGGSQTRGLVSEPEAL